MKLIIITTLLAASLISFAQQKISGTITDNENNPLYSANIYINELEIGTQSNFNGKFSINKIPNHYEEINIKISYVGFQDLERIVKLPHEEPLKINLEVDILNTDEVVVTENREGVYLRNSPVKIEVITTKHLEKNFNIDLTQACEYTPGIKVQDNCGVCGTTDIRIQGLEGQYSQILIDGHPIVSNLGTVYGLMGINTSNIKQIEIVKGPGTILYGPEAISGTINIILKQPSELRPFSLSLDATTHMEHAMSAAAVHKWNNTATSLIFDYSGNYNKIDENNDGFTDVPLFERYSILNQWMTDFNENTSLKVFGRYYYEDRFGGELNWNRSHRGGSEVYGESIFTKRGELFGGLDNQVSEKSEIQFNFSSVYHDQNSYYGNTLYDAQQFTSYVDLISINELDDFHTATFGAAYKFDRYDDNSVVTITPANSHIFSLFAQDEIKFSDLVTSQLGLRYNYHDIQKSIWQPRASIKVSPYTYSTIRLAFGTGFRTINLFTEDHAAYTGSREIEILESLNPERSINTTLSYVQNIPINSHMINFEISGHYTRFSNQIIPDYSDVKKVIYKNLDGYSQSSGMEASITYEHLFIPFRMNLSYEYLDTYKVEDNVKSEIEFNPNHTFYLDMDYKFEDIGLTMNVSGKLVGEQKLPLFLEPIPRPTVSDPYSIWNINFQKEFEYFILAVGLKNIFNYLQPSPLIDPKNPFGDYFDTAYVYAPLHGRELTMSIKLGI